MLKILFLLLMMLFAQSFFAQPLFAMCGLDHGDAASAPKQSVAPESLSAVPVSKLGAITGGGCASDSDCFVGCLNGQESNHMVTCITKNEGSAACLSFWGGNPPPGGLECGCLSDVRHCGYFHL